MTDWQPLPSNKSLDIENMLMGLYGKDRRQVILNKECMSCAVTDIVEESFTDELSLREYHISGLCQTCQDAMFGGTEK